MNSTKTWEHSQSRWRQAEAKKNALTILTISDHLFKAGELTAKERETGFTDMMEIALKTAIQL